MNHGLQHNAEIDLHVGDFVRDPIDGQFREVVNICWHVNSDATVVLKGGGEMALHDCGDIYLPSEVEA